MRKVVADNLRVDIPTHRGSDKPWELGGRGDVCGAATEFQSAPGGYLQLVKSVNVHVFGVKSTVGARKHQERCQVYKPLIPNSFMFFLF